MKTIIIENGVKYLKTEIKDYQTEHLVVNDWYEVNGKVGQFKGYDFGVYKIFETLEGKTFIK